MTIIELFGDIDEQRQGTEGDYDVNSSSRPSSRYVGPRDPLWGFLDKNHGKPCRLSVTNYE